LLSVSLPLALGLLLCLPALGLRGVLPLRPFSLCCLDAGLARRVGILLSLALLLARDRLVAPLCLEPLVARHHFILARILALPHARLPRPRCRPLLGLHLALPHAGLPRSRCRPLLG